MLLQVEKNHTPSVKNERYFFKKLKSILIYVKRICININIHILLFLNSFYSTILSINISIPLSFINRTVDYQNLT